MCGILGYYGNSVSEFCQKTSIDMIGHRGPDNQDLVQGANYFLAHTRLSIQDTSSYGDQPMISKDENYVLIFNGEIYNHRELRKNLLNEIRFRSTGDTETLLEGLIKFGTKFINDLNGIFAFSFYNFTTGEIIIARDHFGVKPLYYHLNDHEVYFASELKAISKYCKKGVSIDEESLKNYLKFLWSPGKKTPFREFQKLLPGTYLEGNVNDIKSFTIQRYYTVPFNDKELLKDSEANLINALEGHLLEAVERQMLSDVPLGFFLSGGVDSSLLVALARHLNPKKEINCYTIRLDTTDGFTDDLYYAKKVAEHLNVNLKVVDAKSDVLESFDKVIYHLDEPQADAAPINVYNICKAAREDGIKVLIGGAGGDDIFSGYRRHQALTFNCWIEKVPKSFRIIIRKIIGKLSQNSLFNRRLRKLTRDFDESKEGRMMGFFSWIDESTLQELFLTPNVYDCFSYFKKISESLAGETSDLNKMLFWEINSFLVDHNLNYTDKLSMAVGVEVRVPFLDTKLVEFSAKIPPKLKIKGKETKFLLKKVAEKYLPKEVVYRAKTGFGAPVRDWIINEMDDLIEEYLSEKTISGRGIFDPRKVSKLVEENREGRIDASYPIWALLAIESWMRQFYD
ncbi:asparagine synthase (glutamine-hydrolyzing) [Akkermansiaceae bacterium]|nr:asparagine synthase (glutamine-hydrolyzing) [Akkermansiaceae bacterium]